MSFKVADWVRREPGAFPDVSATDRHVLIMLALHADDDGTEARPSVSTLAQETGLNEKTVRRALHNLEEKKAIRCRRIQGRGVRVYEIQQGTEEPLDRAESPGVGSGQPVQSGRRVRGTAGVGSDDSVPDSVQTSRASLRSARAPAMNGQLSLEPTAKRKRDVLWDVFDEVIGPITNKSERGKRNRALAIIRESLAAEGEQPDGGEARLREAIASFEARWTEIDVTELGVANNWSVLNRPMPNGKHTGVGVSAGELQPFIEELRRQGR